MNLQKHKQNAFHVMNNENNMNIPNILTYMLHLKKLVKVHFLQAEMSVIHSYKNNRTKEFVGYRTWLQKYFSFPKSLCFFMY